MKFIILSLTLMTAVFLWLLPSTAFTASPLNVHVSILPQKYFVERIGRNRVRVDVLVKPGKSPGTYSPTPDQIRQLVSCDVFFRIGVPFENGFLNKIESIAGSKIVDTRQGITLRDMTEHSQDHQETSPDTGTRHLAADPHDAEENHDHTGKDPHIWMNPLLVKTQAATILKTLLRIDPDGKDFYQANHDLFVKDLDDLDHRIKTALTSLEGERLFVFHPSFGYFTDAYGLRQVAVESMGKAPKGKELSNIIKLAKKQNARVIFVQPQFDRNAAEKIASAINGAVVSIDPLAYEYLANMEYMAKTIAKTLKK